MDFYAGKDGQLRLIGTKDCRQQGHLDVEKKTAWLCPETGLKVFWRKWSILRTYAFIKVPACGNKNQQRMAVLCRDR